MRRPEAAAETRQIMSVEELKESDPVEIAMRFADDIGEELSDEAIGLLRETIAIVKEELRN